MYTITIVEVTGPVPGEPNSITRYTQTVDALDIKAVIDAINRKPRAPRKKPALAHATDGSLMLPKKVITTGAI